MNANELMERLQELTPEDRELPLFTYSGKYGLWFPLGPLDLYLARDILIFHSTWHGDLYQWDEYLPSSVLDKNNEVVEVLKLL
jgi:hypothetical protein